MSRDISTQLKSYGWLAKRFRDIEILLEDVAHIHSDSPPDQPFDSKFAKAMGEVEGSVYAVQNLIIDAAKVDRSAVRYHPLLGESHSETLYLLEEVMRIAEVE